MTEKVVLAYSGGLDTTVAVRWLMDSKGLDVVAVAVDVGQAGDLEAIRERAMKSGAVDAVMVDAVDEFASDFVVPSLHANALYQQKYPLVSALSRPLISKHLAEAAAQHGAAYVAHGCTGKGNDQVRFEVSLAAIAPELTVLAPIREWGMTREDAISYGMDAGLPIPVGPVAPYSIDENLWGRTIECGILEDPMVEPPADIWARTADPFDAPDEPVYLEIGFERGVPVSLDGEAVGLPTLIRAVEKVAGEFGYGRVDMIEDRVVGIKSREIYEVPGALALITAHADLEELTLDREVLRLKRMLEQRYAQLVYEGLWYSPLREAMDAFMGETAKHVNGTVRLRFEPGNARVVGRSSPGSLYDYSVATYDKEDSFDHSAAEGFVKLWGLPLKIWARTKQKLNP
ncbi:MAG: argininosuccinate synthase [Actinobacteria bacterium]|nr:argininosuccinate synthase [Actinomycetota bacterium]